MPIDADPCAALAGHIDDLLPQTQCRRCGYPACRPYAEAVARGEAVHNRCAPGGDETIQALAALLGRAPLPLDPEVGTTVAGQVACIDEQACIGCALCLPACPVDAILGAPKQLHTVLRRECTGCELCLPVCPVDCIALLAQPARPKRRDPLSEAYRARIRYRHHCERGERERASRTARRARAAAQRAPASDKAAVIRAAVERVRARRAARADTLDGGREPP